jgi:hypothetical protein
MIDRSLPVPVSGISGVVAIAAGASHSLALKDDGTFWAWGDNNYGQLGTGGADSQVPVQITPFCSISTSVEDDRGKEQAPFPNPTSGRITLPVPVRVIGTVTVSIVDPSGRLLGTPVMKDQTSPGRVSVDMGGLDAGIYLVVVRAGDMQRIHRVLVE